MVSKRSKDNKNGLKQIKNQRENFGEKLDPDVGQIISGTKCDRDKPIFFQKKEVTNIKLGIK